MSARFDRIASETVYDGRIATVRRDRFRYDDGEEAEREIVAHPGAVGIVAHDGESVFLVRQPREAIDTPDLLEIPAGKLDVEGEQPLENARRELAEEIGKGSDHWIHLKTYWSSAGWTNEQVHVYLAEQVHDVPQQDSGEDERIEVVTWPLSDLDGLIDVLVDAKSLIGVLELRRRVTRG
jgi:8-oxo-dGTP pyrophosphatase MutT (NUDIX family)